MEPLSSVADVEAILGRSLSTSEQVSALFRVRQASGIVRRFVSTVDARIADGSLDSDLVAGVVAEMVAALLRNPDGKVSESIDDYTYRRHDSVADGRLRMTDEMIDLLSPSTSTAGAFTIRPAGQPDYCAPTYVAPHVCGPH